MWYSEGSYDKPGVIGAAVCVLSSFGVSVVSAGAAIVVHDAEALCSSSISTFDA